MQDQCSAIHYWGTFAWSVVYCSILVDLWSVVSSSFAGSGKTLAYLLPLLQRHVLSADPSDTSLKLIVRHPKWYERGWNEIEIEEHHRQIWTHETLCKRSPNGHALTISFSKTFGDILGYRSSDSSDSIVFSQVVAPTSDLVLQIAEVARVASARSQRGFQVSGNSDLSCSFGSLVNPGNRKISTSSGGFFQWDFGEFLLPW